jgi:hypothetical protein
MKVKVLWGILAVALIAFSANKPKKEFECVITYSTVVESIREQDDTLLQKWQLQNGL